MDDVDGVQSTHTVPGDDGFPLVGHGLELVRHPRRFLAKRYERYGPVFRLNVFFETGVVMLGPELTEAVFTDKSGAFSNEGYRLVFMDLFPRGLFIQDGEEHRHHRRVMQHAFTRTALRGYIELMQPLIKAHVASWAEKPRRLLYPAFDELVLAITARVFFGLDLGDSARKLNAAFKTLLGGTVAMVRASVPGLAVWRAHRARRLLVKALHELTEERRKHPAQDLLGALCQAETETGARLTAEEIVDHVLFMMFAAHDTSASAMTSVAYVLARHPEWQEAVRAETAHLDDKTPSLEDLDRLTTCSAVIKESLRLYSNAILIPRRTTRDVDVLGIPVPKGKLIWLSPDFTHHMEELWPEPERFDPHRHLSGERRHRFAWMPWGGGAHTCIGMAFAEAEIKLAMHELCRRYRFEVPPGYVADYQLVPVPKPKDELPVILHPRAA